MASSVRLADISFAVNPGEVLGLDRTPTGRARPRCWKRSPAWCPWTTVGFSGAARSPALPHRREFMFYLPDGLRPWEDEYVARVIEFFAAAYGRPARHHRRSHPRARPRAGSAQAGRRVVERLWPPAHAGAGADHAATACC